MLPLGLLEAVEMRDPRVIECGENLRLALEPVEPLAITREFVRKHFDRDFAPELGIASPIDLPHATRAERLDNFVVKQAAAGFENHYPSVIALRLD